MIESARRFYLSRGDRRHPSPKAILAAAQAHFEAQGARPLGPIVADASHFEAQAQLVRGGGFWSTFLPFVECWPTRIKLHVRRVGEERYSVDALVEVGTGVHLTGRLESRTLEIDLLLLERALTQTLPAEPLLAALEPSASASASDPPADPTQALAPVPTLVEAIAPLRTPLMRVALTNAALAAVLVGVIAGLSGLGWPTILVCATLVAVMDILGVRALGDFLLERSEALPS